MEDEVDQLISCCEVVDLEECVGPERVVFVP